MASWIWHPDWAEEAFEGSAGAFVHFRKTISLANVPSLPVLIHITADTKYKLYINSRLVAIGPVKGDRHLWFYDELDIVPYLQPGQNTINVRVLRLYYATQHATSFPRLHQPGLFIRHTGSDAALTGSGACIHSDRTWETALDRSTRLPTDIREDDFLHVYEKVNARFDLATPNWVAAMELQFPSSHGLSAPWKLAPRAIPSPQYRPGRFKTVCTVSSPLPRADWENTLLNQTHSVLLPRGTEHYLELEAEAHMTAFPSFIFEWPRNAGSVLRVTYSECYEDTPTQVPYLRHKGDRLDTTKQIIGPQDEYIFGGAAAKWPKEGLLYNENHAQEEVFAPFHFRTFRLLGVHIKVSDTADLTLKRIDLVKTNYALDVRADINLPSTARIYNEMWTTSLRTLNNCMHDCFEDCPFYEQLQYAMDARSSALFTYCVSGDDRLPRQAIQQLHNSFSPRIGLTASRAPSHQHQIIPHFSLFWICMVADHLQHFGDLNFARQFTPVCDAILETFARRIDATVGLIATLHDPDQWDFVDWTERWRPMGIPPAAARTGFASYTNMLYAYTLNLISPILLAIGRPSIAEEYTTRASSIQHGLRTHCFDGRFFTDGLAAAATADTDYSQHAQVWAVLSGAATGDVARDIMTECTSPESRRFTQASTAMSFYTLRALAIVPGLYETRFHSFWGPWRDQLRQNLTTWVEDTVSNRSDCHAWGSSPLYEFTAEVAGVRVVRQGSERRIVFRPRVALFGKFGARVPVSVGGGVRGGMVHVNWEAEGHGGRVRVSLLLEFDTETAVDLPDGRLVRLMGSETVHLVLPTR